MEMFVYKMVDGTVMTAYLPKGNDNAYKSEISQSSLVLMLQSVCFPV